MANKRISELAPITTADLNQADLLILSDISAHESKKLQLQDLASFFLVNNGFLTGSFFGTASWALRSISSSWAPTQISTSYSSTSSWAYNSITSSYAQNALTSSYVSTSFWAITASYALTSSVQLSYSSSISDFARSASFLIFTPGLTMNNGTASFAISSSRTNSGSYSISSSYAITSSNAISASWAPTTGLISGGSYNISASWASRSLQSTYATSSLTASYLLYNGVFNGTASYALVAKELPDKTMRVNFGVHKARVQTLLAATIDSIVVNSQNTYCSTSIECLGTVTLPFTTSIETRGLIELFSLDKWSGVNQSLDSSLVNVFVAPASGAYATGSMKIPFSLMGEGPMSSSNILYVTASNGIYLDSFRTVRFDIASTSNNVSVSTGEAMTFQAYPTAALMAYTSSLSPGTVQYGTAANIVSTGVNTITDLNASNASSFTKMKYLWTLSNLKFFRCDNNTSLTDIGGVPNSLVTMSCYNCGLTVLAPLTNTSVSILKCGNNSLRALPSLPPTMSFIDCSANSSMLSLPDYLPYGLVTISASSLPITSTPLAFPTSLTSMAFENNSYLTSWYASFPTSLEFFSCKNSPVINIPLLPATVKYLNVSYCNMTPIAIDTICAQLVTNGVVGGTLFINGNNGYLAATAARLATLTTNLWTITS